MNKTSAIWDTYIKIFHGENDEESLKIMQTYMKFFSKNARILLSKKSRFFFSDFIQKDTVKKYIDNLPNDTIKFLADYLFIQMVGAYQLKIAQAIVENDTLKEFNPKENELAEVADNTYIQFLQNEKENASKLDNELIFMHTKIGLDFLRKQKTDFNPLLLNEFEVVLVRAKLFAFIVFESERSLRLLNK